MRLFLSNTTDTLAASQSGTLSKVSQEDFTLFGGQTLQCELPIQPNSLLDSGQIVLNLIYAKSGDVTITPKITLSDRMVSGGTLVPNPETADYDWWLGEEKSTVGNPSPLNWTNTIDYTEDYSYLDEVSGDLNEVQDLRDKVLILQLAVEDVSPGSSVTIGETAFLEVPIIEGGHETYEMATRVLFATYQVTERFFLWSEVDVKEEIKNLYHSSVHFVRDEELRFYTRTISTEDVRLDLYTDVKLYDLRDQPGVFAESVELDNYTLVDDYQLREQRLLSEVVDSLQTLPPVFAPPAPAAPAPPSFVFSGVAMQLAETTNLLLREDEETVPGPLQVYKAGALYGGTFIHRVTPAYGSVRNEIQLPADYLTSTTYTLQIPTLSVPGDHTGALMVCVTGRDVGAFISANLGAQVGDVILDVDSSPDIHTQVFLFRSPTSPFDVVLKISNPTALMPGVAIHGFSVMSVI
jgi:hypothetical protein